MSVKVSVVVPVHNPGRYFDRCLASVIGQSLPPDEYEAILVDDGSTDGTGERLDAAAAAHPNLRVIHGEASGGPGRPRNIGMDAARGEYVYFLDHDDWLGPEALQRMYAAASASSADLVIGKVVGHGRGVAKPLFRRSREKADPLEHGLVGFLTPHKLFRTAFLAAHRIRFVEGPQWLEDHRFVLPAYFDAGVISVVADYSCCHWVKRDEKAANFSARHFDAAAYFRTVREVLDIVDAHVEPGERRDRWYAHWFHGKMLRLFSGRSVPRSLVRTFRSGLYREIRRLTLERFPATVDRWLPVSMRVRAALVRAGSPVGLSRLAAAEHGFTVRPVVERFVWDGESLVLQANARLFYANGNPVRFRRGADGRVRWEPPIQLAKGITEDACDVTDELDSSRLYVYLQNRDDGGDFPLPTDSRMVLEPQPDGALQLKLTGTARLDAATAKLGSPLDAGIWDYVIRVESCGWGVQRRAGRVGSALGDPPGESRHGLRPYWTKTGNLSVFVDRP